MKKLLILLLFISNIGFGQTQTFKNGEIISKSVITKTSDGVEHKWVITGTEKAIDICSRKMNLSVLKYKSTNLDVNLVMFVFVNMDDIYDVRFIGVNK